MADITKDTDEQKKESRIKYLVVAEEKRVGQDAQGDQGSMGTRESRDAEGGRLQSVEKGKVEASTVGQKGTGTRDARSRCSNRACTPPGSSTRTE